jgi:hypothetical protein
VAECHHTSVIPLAPSVLPTSVCVSLIAFLVIRVWIPVAENSVSLSAIAQNSNFEFRFYIFNDT